MGLIKINTKSLKLSPKRLFFGSKKERSIGSRSDPPSFGSGTASYSSSSSSDVAPSSSVHKRESLTPRSVLREPSPEWPEDESPPAESHHLELFQSFKLIDRDGDGVLSRKELESLLTRLGGEPPSKEEVALMLREVGCGGDGHGEDEAVSIEALLSRVGSACGPACDAELRETFDFFDADHDGKITAEELLRVFAALGDERCTFEDCARMIALVDKNGDGFVCFEDFAQMMGLQRY